MKKMRIKTIMLLLLGLFVINTATSQEERKGEFVIEANVGINKYVNYPSLSTIQGLNNASYSAPTEIIVMGYRFSDVLLAAQYQITGVLLSDDGLALNHQTISLMARWYKQLTNKMELYGCIKVGLSIMDNYGGIFTTDYTMHPNRYGFAEEFELGLNYKTSEHTYVGIRAGMTPCTINFGTDIPDHQRILSGYNITLTYGFKF